MRNKSRKRIMQELRIENARLKQKPLYSITNLKAIPIKSVYVAHEEENFEDVKSMLAQQLAKYLADNYLLYVDFEVEPYQIDTYFKYTAHLNILSKV